MVDRSRLLLFPGNFNQLRGGDTLAKFSLIFTKGDNFLLHSPIDKEGKSILVEIPVQPLYEFRLL